MSSSPEEGLKCSLSANPDQKMKRRDFLGLTALWTCVGAWTLTALGLLKFPAPALLPDVSKSFKIGRPEDYPIGTKKIFEDKKVMVARDKSGFYAVSLICTHLGCIVSESKGGYSCPCHGSKFDQDGSVVAGPAPGGLPWLSVSMHPSGKLIVNAVKKVPMGTRFSV